MSARRRKFTTEYKVEAAHRVIDSGRSIAEVARELNVGEQSLGAWVRDERRRIEAVKGTELEPLTGAERAELQRLRKQVAEQEKDLAFLGKVFMPTVSAPGAEVNLPRGGVVAWAL
jgi:transposase-like protein